MIERLYIEIGNICNLACSFCPGTKREKRQMTPDELLTVLNKARGHFKCIYFHVMGEPLLHPALDELFSTLEQLYDTLPECERMPINITTNGTLIPSRGSLLLRHTKYIHKISISLHAPEGNGGAVTEEYLESLAEFAKSAAAAGVFVVFRLWNLSSEERQGKNSENERIEKTLFSLLGTDIQRRQRGYRLRSYIFLDYDHAFVWPTESTAEPYEKISCHGMVNQLAVLADGSVVPCCLDSEGEIVLGNIFSADLEAILESPRAKKMRTGFLRGIATEPLCQKCTFARKFK